MPADVALIGPLVYSLCERRRLPVLVTDLITRHLDERDLLTISILSPTLNKHANSIIYNNIVLDLSEENSWRRVTLLLRTLLTTPVAASNARSLSLIGHPLLRWRRETAWKDERAEAPVRGLTPPEILLHLKTTFTPEELELYHRTGSLRTTKISPDWRISLPRLCLDIISLLQHSLEELHISSDYFRYPGFRDDLRSMFDSGGFRKLQSCSVCEDIIHAKGRPHVDAVRDWDDTLLTPFSAPSIDSIKAVMTLNPEAVNRMPASSITRLTLHHCQIQEYDLNGLLAATPRLCYLEYHATVDWGWYSNHWSPSEMTRSLGLEPVFNALHHVRNTLTELVTFQKFGDDSEHFEWGWAAARELPFRPCYELSKLKYLHTLVVPFASLLGWRPKEGRIFDWHQILPASLHHVTFTDDLSENFMARGWDDESLMPIFSDLAGWLAMCAQGSEPPKFTLRLLQMDEEFHEAGRQAFCRMCEERGVVGKVEKLIKDWTDPNPRYLPRGGGRGGRGRGRGIQ